MVKLAGFIKKCVQDDNFKNSKLNSKRKLLILNIEILYAILRF